MSSGDSSGLPARAGAVDLHGLRVEWNVVGLAFDPVSRLFAGLARAGGHDPRGPDLAIRVDATGATGDAPGEGFRQVFFQGNVRAFARDGELRLVAPAARVSIAADGRRIDASIDPDAVNERGFTNTTLFIAVAIALRHHGLFHMHAGALVRGDGTRVLVMGDAGAGKSTVTLTLLDERARCLGDDTLFLTERAGAPALLAFPRPFHLGPRTLAAFPSLVAGPPDSNGKRDVAVDALPGRPIDRMDAPDVVLFPHITGEPVTRAIPLALDDAFGQTLRSSALLAVDGLSRAAEQMRLLGALLAPSQAFELRVGADWLADVQRAAELVPWTSASGVRPPR